MAQRDDRKRLGKKHRQASTRPKKGRAPRVAPTTGAVDPRKRKALSAKKAALEKKKRTPSRSPEKESRRTLTPKRGSPRPGAPSQTASPSEVGKKPARPGDHIVGRHTPNSANIGRPHFDPAPDATADDLRQWDRAEQLAAQLEIATPNASNLAPSTLPLIAICGRPNVGKSTLFNRLTGSRRSIVGDEPGITRDRIYGLVDWQSAGARLVDTGGIVPDDPALIPAEIFRQAQVALAEADAIIMVIDGRTELAAPDLALARILLRGGKPVFLAVNKIDTEALQPQAENFRRLGFRNVLAISAEHGLGIGDLLDQVFAVLPAAPAVTAPEAFLTESDELDEDATGPDYTEPPGADLSFRSNPLLSSRSEAEGSASASSPDDPDRPRLLRSHGSFESHETKIAIIGRPNVGKSTLLNALTGSDRAIVSPIAGTTRDAVDEVVTRAGHDFRFVDTAGIRRKGKTKLMAEKLSVIMARKHLEAADVSLLVLDATEGVHALDANIGGYAHESGRSVIIVVNKWDLITHPPTNLSSRAERSGVEGPASPVPSQKPGAPSFASSSEGWDVKKSAQKSSHSAPLLSSRSAAEGSASITGDRKPADPKIYEQQVRDHLKFLDYAPIVFLSATAGRGIEGLFKKVELVARERRKRVTTGQMNRFLARVDFQRASVPMNRRVKIYYMTQAAVAPPTFVLFTDKDVKLHFAFERFLANQIREAFGFIGSPIWFKTRPRNKKSQEE
jgi:GTP-binding protein